MHTSRDEAKEYLTKKLKKKIKPEVFDANLEGLIDEYLEVQKFIIDNGSDINELPNKKNMKSWFIDPIDQSLIDEALEEGDGICEIKLDDIYLGDKYFAKPIYKELYDWKWETGTEIPKLIKELIILYKSIDKLDYRQKKNVEIRLFNLAILGSVRFYHLERKPYLKGEEIAKIIQHFKMVLDVIYKIEQGFYGGSKINGYVYLFDAFGTKSNTESPLKKKTRKKKKVEPKNDGSDAT